MGVKAGIMRAKKRAKIAAAIVLLEDDEEEQWFAIMKHYTRLLNEPSIVSDSWWTDVVPTMRADQFRTRFRMSRETMAKLGDILSFHEDNGIRVGRPPKTDIYQRIAVFMYYCSRITSIEDVADHLGLHKTTTWNALHSITKSILKNLLPHVLRFPDEDECEELSRVWEQRQPSMRGAVLACDCTLIPIERPHKNPESYFCRKSFYAVNLLVCCDPHLKARFVYGLYPGSAQDSRLLSRSGLIHKLINLLPYFALGDNGFPLRPYMMIPFPGYLSRSKRIFNFTLSSCRIDIERFFGHLKGRFRRLRYPSPNGSTRFFYALVLATIAIHNWIQINSLESSEDFYAEFKNDASARTHVNDERCSPQFDRNHPEYGLHRGRALREELLKRVLDEYDEKE
eukprot:TRINITY_DN1194_c0_g1_i11.p1 TRINITY_DN1194_c0_g1~~TRINITY_DN1194_c0_g1_i11.p1  ORF type:complete len:407 (-),score=-19.49 TRINITY_DN1194_c0_g1_i11:41-1231(-)